MKKFTITIEIDSYEKAAELWNRLVISNASVAAASYAELGSLAMHDLPDVDEDNRLYEDWDKLDDILKPYEK